MMKKLSILLIFIASLCGFVTNYAGEHKDHPLLKSKESIPSLSVADLKAMIDANIPFVLLDARGPKWYHGELIPGAKLAFYTDTAEELAELIPEKTDLVVVYCANPTCPLSKKLADKLTQLGYQNIIEYQGGIVEWRDVAHYPVDSVVKN